MVSTGRGVRASSGQVRPVCTSCPRSLSAGTSELGHCYLLLLLQSPALGMLGRARGCAGDPQRMPCPNACDDDSGCLQDQKCCFTTCGFTCVTPLGNGSSDLPPPREMDWSLSQAENTHQGDAGGMSFMPGGCARRGEAVGKGCK
uniref:WAP domain-containing protein n=1 Tax=Pavo cristatus TaxID=9049 RepID=A0A8C9EM22_PAVCR